MTANLVTVLVGKDWDVTVQVNGFGGPELSSDRPISFEGLDARLVRTLTRWLENREYGWKIDDLRAFGQLLRRVLFRDEVLWEFVENHIAATAENQCRLMLAFPSDGPASRLASLPWEYLHTPELDGGTFLAADPRVVLARSLPMGTFDDTEPIHAVRILPVSSNPSEEGLGPVEATQVEEAMRQACSDRPDLEVLDLRQDPTLAQLAELVRNEKPQVLHYVGHGRFYEGSGQLAFFDEYGDYRWEADAAVASAVCSSHVPQVVVLHSCAVGKVDFDFRFAGLAPELVSRGVRCVVAMQYIVLDTDALEFSKLLYTGFASGLAIDSAVQRARAQLAQGADPRLIGMPLIYERGAPSLGVESSSP